ncbi:hypothetical protein llap_16259 [Limosa lapponica baueri]|uniref:Uncharacterized protein n=1 Tax=Limosa lapponica baueri TaxID=1758121 RepID=A0A2I0TI25_LIMLA|nr:hypothetical protein llap_16259 [Limosa lapponica baueri]
MKSSVAYDRQETSPPQNHRISLLEVSHGSIKFPKHQSKGGVRILGPVAMVSMIQILYNFKKEKAPKRSPVLAKEKHQLRVPVIFNPVANQVKKKNPSKSSIYQGIQGY